MRTGRALCRSNTGDYDTNSGAGRRRRATQISMFRRRNTSRTQNRRRNRDDSIRLLYYDLVSAWIINVLGSRDPRRGLDDCVRRLYCRAASVRLIIPGAARNVTYLSFCALTSDLECLNRCGSGRCSRCRWSGRRMKITCRNGIV